MTRPAGDIKTLVQGFALHIRQLKSPEYKESALRLHYLDPFWRLLGWDVSNDEQRPPQDLEVLVEPSMDSAEDDGLRSREPDYLMRILGFPRFVAEAKKPSVDIDTDKNAIFQAKRYAWSAAIPFAVLTDFEQFRLYDTTLKPILNEPTRGLVREFSFNFEDYPAKWEEIVATFGRDAVAEGSLERLRARIRKVPSGRRIRTVDRMLIDLRGDEPVDRVFLDYLETYRKHIARAIYEDNKSRFPDANSLHGAARLTEAVQRLIDRLIFMRVCEDRGIAEYGTLRTTLARIGGEGGDLYQTLCAEFRKLDREYNGYLFKFHFSEELDVSGHVLSDFVRSLYPPEAPWNFAAIGDDILGIVYERFLGNVVTVRLGHAEVTEKPEVRHAGGVYYTPRFIVDTILRRTVGPKLEGKTPQEVLNVKILDPACGSGSFLVAAFQYLMDHCVKAIAEKPALAKSAAPPKSGGRKNRKRDIAFKDKKGAWQLAPDFKAALLTNCIHGVDIDQQAVEVTVMSLYLKMLEGKLPQNWQAEWLAAELLPSLDNNICCGNSLIAPNEFARYVEAAFGGLFPTDEDILFRLNRFDWESRILGFGRVLGEAARETGRTGFDCIIGNPPYIRVQELNKWAPDECEFYKWKYKSAEKGNYDIYVVFVERCLELLATDGLLGFIMPHKFWQAKYGEGLRKLVAEKKYLRSVIDFGDQQVFRGATTYTAVHIFDRHDGNRMVDYARVFDLQDGPKQCASLDANEKVVGVEHYKASRPEGNAPWSFVATKDRMRSKFSLATTQPLGTIARLAQGIKTSADRVFVVDLLESTGRFSTIMSAQTERRHVVETAVLWPLIKSEHMKRIAIDPTNKALLFPYETEKGTYRPIPPTKWESRYPKAWNYLTELRDVLQARERGRMKTRDDWYAYIYPKNFAAMASAKLVIPDIAARMQVGIDGDGTYIFSGGAAGGNAIIPQDASNLYLLAGILNSRLIETDLRQTGTKFRGGYLNCEIRFIRDLPIKLPETASEKKQADRIVESVREIMAAKTKLQRGNLSDREQNSLARDIELHERRIDEAVFKLYGVSELPA